MFSWTFSASWHLQEVNYILVFSHLVSHQLTDCDHGATHNSTATDMVSLRTVTHHIAGQFIRNRVTRRRRDWFMNINGGHRRVSFRGNSSRLTVKIVIWWHRRWLNSDWITAPKQKCRRPTWCRCSCFIRFVRSFCDFSSISFRW